MELSKAEILARAEKFNLSDPLTEDEFEEGLDYVTTMLLVGTKWEAPLITNPKMRRKFPVIDDMSLTCKIDECPYATKCPVLKKIHPQHKIKLLNTDCRADREYGTRLFAEYVKDLEINPERFTDVMLVAQLIRIYVTMRRCDWQMAIDGLQIQDVAAVTQKTERIIYRRESHPLVKVVESLHKQEKNILAQLLASRKDRASLAASLGAKGLEAVRGLFASRTALPQPSEVIPDLSTPTEETV